MYLLIAGARWSSSSARPSCTETGLPPRDLPSSTATLGARAPSSHAIEHHWDTLFKGTLDDDWRNILMTLIIRTCGCEANRKQSEFECNGLITSALELLVPNAQAAVNSNSLHLAI